MELARQEAKMRKPKNYGELQFKSLRRREHEPPRERPPKPAVFDHLQLQPTVTGPLDATRAVFELTEEEQCEFFTHYPKCKCLILRRWEKLSDNVLRCISFTMGDSLEEVDFSFSQIRPIHLEILMPRLRKLRSMKISGCPHVNGACMNILARLAASTMEELQADQCPLFSSEPLLWMTGSIGFNAPKLSRITTLDLALCPLEDKGLAAVATCCFKLRFLNINECGLISDASLVPLVAVNPELRLVSLRNVNKITNKVLLALGANCPDLVSLNLFRCENISNKGLDALKGCPRLQCLNLSGLNKLDEKPLVTITNNCRGLSMLNVTGISAITVNGLNSLIHGMDKVELARSYVGFKPVDNHVEKRLEGHLAMIKDDAIQHIKKEKKKERLKRESKEKYLREYTVKAADTIKKYMYGYKLRMGFWRIWQERRRLEGAITLQRLWRGILGRAIFKVKWDDYQYFLAHAPQAICIQRWVRGHHDRVHSPLVAQAMRDMYNYRAREAEAIVAVRFQANARRFLATKRVEAWREICSRRNIDETNSILIMQMLARRYNATKELLRRRYEKIRKDKLEDRASRKIQQWYNKQLNRYLSKLSGVELQKAMNRTWKMTLLLQRAYRGFKGRERINKMRIHTASLNYAATVIQKTFRGARILYWKDMRLNVIAAYALDRQYIERRESVAASRLRYKAYVIENQRDSASNSEDPEDPDADVEWVLKHDKKMDKPYWINPVTEIITYDEPPKPFAKEMSLIGYRVRVFWTAQEMWYEGAVTDFHKRKRRHRIEYDDGDHEWLNIEMESERVQIQEEDGSWIMVLMHKAPGDLMEMNKVSAAQDEAKFKLDAMEDACQWKLIQSDQQQDAVIYISTRTGEIRAGTIDSEDWVVHEDEFGYPCFFNLLSEETVYEDPRFIHDTDEDLNQQREYLYAEARLALYFCKDFWDRYVEAKEEEGGQNEREMRRILLQVANSPKPKHLASFLIRLKAFFKKSSIIDKPMHMEEKADMELMEFVAARMSEMQHEADEIIAAKRQTRYATVQHLEIKFSGKEYICPKCGRDTQRHLEYCANCNWKQIWM